MDGDMWEEWLDSPVVQDIQEALPRFRLRGLQVSVRWLENLGVSYARDLGFASGEERRKAAETNNTNTSLDDDELEEIINLTCSPAGIREVINGARFSLDAKKMIIGAAHLFQLGCYADCCNVLDDLNVAELLTILRRYAAACPSSVNHEDMRTESHQSYRQAHVGSCSDSTVMLDSASPERCDSRADELKRQQLYTELARSQVVLFVKNLALLHADECQNGHRIVLDVLSGNMHPQSSTAALTVKASLTMAQRLLSTRNAYLLSSPAAECMSGGDSNMYDYNDNSHRIRLPSEYEGDFLDGFNLWLLAAALRASVPCSEPVSRLLLVCSLWKEPLNWSAWTDLVSLLTDGSHTPLTESMEPLGLHVKALLRRRGESGDHKNEKEAAEAFQDEDGGELHSCRGTEGPSALRLSFRDYLPEHDVTLKKAWAAFHQSGGMARDYIETELDTSSVKRFSASLGLPPHWMNVFGYGLYLQATGRPYDASVLYKQLQGYSLFQLSPYLLAQLGKCAHEANHAGDAVEIFRLLQQRDPSCLDYRMEFVDDLLATDQVEEAANIATQCERAAPDAPETLCVQAHVLYCIHGDIDQAINFVIMALQVHYRFSNAWRLLGDLYSHQRMPSERALRCYVAAVNLYPDDTRAWLGLALNSDDPFKSVKYAEAAAMCSPSTMECWEQLAAAYQQAGYFGRARLASVYCWLMEGKLERLSTIWKLLRDQNVNCEATAKWAKFFVDEYIISMHYLMTGEPASVQTSTPLSSIAADLPAQRTSLSFSFTHEPNNELLQAPESVTAALQNLLEFSTQQGDSDLAARYRQYLQYARETPSTIRSLHMTNPVEL